MVDHLHIYVVFFYSLENLQEFTNLNCGATSSDTYWTLLDPNPVPIKFQASVTGVVATEPDRGTGT